MDSLRERLNAFLAPAGEETIASKVLFLLAVLVAFIILINVGMALIKYFNSVGEASPVLISGMKPASEPRVITQDPNLASSVTLFRSEDEKEGIEFTYSTWMYINGLRENDGSLRHVFSKGNVNRGMTDTYKTTGEHKGLVMPDNGPGLYIDSGLKNNLVVVMNTFQTKATIPTAVPDTQSLTNYDTVTESIVVPNVPMKKWLHVVIRVKGRNVDVYVNGTIVKRHVLYGVPKQNYGDVQVNRNGGYDGYISSLRYYNYALQPSEIASLTAKGPNMKVDNSLYVFPPFFSLSWYVNGAGYNQS